MPLAASAAELRDVRVWAGPDNTRVVFELNGLVDHKLFTLDNPNRIVIDLSDTQRAVALKAQLEGKGYVDRVRFGPRDGGLRVVLDLHSAVKPRSFSLQPADNYGYRVVVDLYSDAPAAAPAPEAAPAAAPAVATPPRPSAAPAPSAPAPVIAERPHLAEKPIVVAIDAGHGGEDPGTRGHRGLLEKDVSLALARRLAAMVDDQPGFKAVLTRDGDYYLKLETRVKKARDAHADLFVSIHENSFKDRAMRGTAVYVLSPKGASSAQAKLLQERENSSDVIGGVDLQTEDPTTKAVLVDVFQTSSIEASFDVGRRVLKSVGRVNSLQKPKVQQASFVVLKAPDVPSILVETAFLSNPEEERLLGDPAYQDTLARSMLEGIKGYFDSLRPPVQQAAYHPSLGGGAPAIGVGSATR
jgi:N-acetylmuramoyl-L-alanine amidase